VRRRAAPLDPRQTDKVIASLIDQATAAAAAGRFEEAEARLVEHAGVNPNGAPCGSLVALKLQDKLSRSPGARNLHDFPPLPR
jgi:hypothetical protein